MDMDINVVKRQFNIIGDCQYLNQAIKNTVFVSKTDLPILITGENGVGKESFSRIIHHYSKYKNGPFVVVNCGAIPQGTIDSELFGHEKGSFTGAIDKRKGYFEEASNGTIFLDEIGEMPLETQTKLLRVLENNEIIHVGSSKVQKINCRIIAATNVDLIKAVENHKFREDLYYRLNCINIKIPALRERENDIIMLFYKFANDFAIKYEVQPIMLQPDAEELLLKYNFPGNIRQLKNIVWQISVLEVDDKKIDAVKLQKYLPQEEQKFLTKYDCSDYEDKLKLLYKFIIEMKAENNEIKKVLFNILKHLGLDEKSFDEINIKTKNKSLTNNIPQ